MAEINVNDCDCFGFYECPFCGNDEIELGQKFCEECGEAIEWKED